MTPTDLTPQEPEVLLFQPSPYGNLDGIVQQDGRTIYFYLNESGESKQFGTRACWVRNLGKGPLVINRDDMESGVPPMLPRTQAIHPEGQPPLAGDSLSIVWFEEGNGAALVEHQEEGFNVLAVIPPWSGVDGFAGYASGCSAESPLCWPMPENPGLKQRIDAADEFWSSFSKRPDPFVALQKQQIEMYQRQIGFGDIPLEDQTDDRSYFEIDGGKFPPRGLVELKAENSWYFFTVGMSLCPQPAVELFSQESSKLRRIELAIRLPIDATNGQRDAARNGISGLAAYPWHGFTWLGSGHTVQLAGVQAGCDNGLLVNDTIAHSDHPMPLNDFRGDPVNLLWIKPITAEQQQGLEAETLKMEDVLV